MGNANLLNYLWDMYIMLISWVPQHRLLQLIPHSLKMEALKTQKVSVERYIFLGIIPLEFKEGSMNILYWFSMPITLTE